MSKNNLTLAYQFAHHGDTPCILVGDLDENGNINVVGVGYEDEGTIELHGYRKEVIAHWTRHEDALLGADEECSNCHVHVCGATPYCPGCGAKMKSRVFVSNPDTPNDYEVIEIPEESRR